MLDGAFPDSIFGLQNLEMLEIYSNRLSGTVEMDQFMRLKQLTVLYLSSNNLTLLSESETSPNTSSLPMFNELGLGSCNLRQFPNLLRDQNQLAYLDLSGNNLQGQMPRWIWEMSLETLLLLDLSFNSLTGFHESPTGTLLPWSNILLLDLSSNLLQGSPPIPSISIIVYLASNNSFTGEIPRLFCSMASLRVLDLSRNNLSGIVPQCLSKVSKSLSAKINGNVQNAGVSRHWEQSNQGYLAFLVGEIKSGDFDSVFPKLRVIDVSNNGFTGLLPSSYLESWTAMKRFHVEHLSYMQSNLYDHMFMAGLTIPDEYNYSMTMTNKGIKMEYTKILEVFMAIDLSCNEFRGKIPESVGNLKGLQLLNLSNNLLVGQIPSVIGNLTSLEALDLSHNQFAGRIPWQLRQLNFPEVFNVSYNNLSGPIPQGRQFDTFPNTSFDGNLGLCGNPLSKKCEELGF
ncbi:hypothetical protein GQ457_06G042910 [Hibiscus cannabinus]